MVLLDVVPQEVGAHREHFRRLLVQVVLQIDTLLGAGRTEKDLLDVRGDLQEFTVLLKGVRFKADLRVDWPGLQGIFDWITPDSQVVSCKQGVAQVLRVQASIFANYCVRSCQLTNARAEHSGMSIADANLFGFRPDSFLDELVGVLVHLHEVPFDLLMQVDRALDDPVDIASLRPFLFK